MSSTGAVNEAEAEVWPQPSPSPGLAGRLVKPLVTLLLYVIIFYRLVDERAVLALLRSVRLDLVAGAVFIYSAGQLLSAWRWQLLLPPVQLAARYSHLAAFYFIGMFFNIFLPTIVGGDAVKALLLSRETGAPARATMSVFMERNVGLFALLTIATVAAAAGPGAQRVAGIPLILWTLAGWAAFIAANVVMLNVRAYRFADRLIALLPLGQMRLRSESLFQAILPYTRAPLPMLAATALSFVHQAIVIIVVFLNVNALGHAVPISALAVIVPLVSLAGMLPISLNGLGVREALYILFLGQHGLSPDVALSVALLYFAVPLIASLPGGLLYAARRTAR